MIHASTNNALQDPIVNEYKGDFEILFVDQAQSGRRSIHRLWPSCNLPHYWYGVTLHPRHQTVGMFLCFQVSRTTLGSLALYNEIPSSEKTASSYHIAKAGHMVLMALAISARDNRARTRAEEESLELCTCGCIIQTAVYMFKIPDKV
jgi:hypothetical protein